MTLCAEDRVRELETALATMRDAYRDRDNTAHALALQNDRLRAELHRQTRLVEDLRHGR